MLAIQFENLINHRQISKLKKIELSQYLSSIKKDIKPDIKKCVICGEENCSFCRSHSIPKFILKKLASNGSIIVGSDFMSPTIEKHGLNNTLLFSCICEKCDNEYFQEYEKPSLIDAKLGNLAINEIAAKIYLRHYYKRLKEQMMWQLLIEENNKTRGPDFQSINQQFNNKLLTTNLDISDAKKRIKKCINKKNDDLFYVIDELNLDYETQLSYQGAIAISEGFDGTVNELFNYDPNYKIEPLYLCIFPFNGRTKILVFCEEGSTRLKRFYKTYRKLDLESKLYVLNYLLMMYEEEWCLPGDFDKTKLNRETLELIGLTTTFNVDADNEIELKADGEKILKSKQEEMFRIETNGNIYNFLDRLK